MQLAAIVAAQKLSLTAIAPTLFNIASNAQASAKLRVASLEALGDFHDSHLQEAVEMSMADGDRTVREAGMKLLAQINPGDAVKALDSVLQQGTLREKQSALAELGAIKGDAPDKLLAEWLDDLIGGKVPKEIQLDVINAVTNRDAASIKDKVKQYESSRRGDDEFVGFRETLYGGNAAAGKKIFMERPDVSCLRCHKVRGKGGEVGPDLAGIITRHDREYILESILFPNKQIAAGFERV